MSLSPQAKQELVWWIDNIATTRKPTHCTNPDLVIQSDASNSGWGAVRDKVSTGGRCADCEQMEHISMFGTASSIHVFCFKIPM